MGGDMGSHGMFCAVWGMGCPSGLLARRSPLERHLGVIPQGQSPLGRVIPQGLSPLGRVSYGEQYRTPEYQSAWSE
jgi:hypothetical protein